jgi:hypothetical protein
MASGGFPPAKALKRLPHRTLWLCKIDHSFDEDSFPVAYGQHENRAPTYGYEATREAAMAAFAKSWRRE